MADVNLRRLVEAAVPLATERARSPQRTHPLGRNIKARKTYEHPLGPVALPDNHQALDELAATVGREIPPVPDEFQDLAWRGLLGTPGAVVPLRATSALDLLSEEIAVTEAELSRLRRVALFTVFRPDPEFDSSGLVAARRVAGMARLSVLLAEDKNVADRAWLDVSWAWSTRNAIRWLEHQMLGAWMSPARSAGSSGAVPVDLLIGAELASDLPADFRDCVSGSSRLLGLSVTTTDLATTDFARARDRMAVSGRHLLVLGRRDNSMEALASAFRDAGAVKEVQYLTGPFGSVLDDLREQFASIAAVSSSLQPHALIQPVAIEPGRPVLPVQVPAECRHWGTRVYVLDGETDLWWTRDDAHHADVPFKTYTVANQTLIHEAERDLAGDVYTGKHKGRKGRTVPLVETFSCPWTENHVGRPKTNV